MTQMITTTRLRVILVLVIVAAGWGAWETRNLALAVISIVSGLLLAAGFGGAGSTESRITAWRGRVVRVEVWGASPFPAVQGELRLVNTWALGVGLHFHVSVAGAKPVHIKVAQPGSVETGEGRLVIGRAKYVQVSGRTIARGSAAAFTMELVNDGLEPVGSRDRDVG